MSKTKLDDLPASDDAEFWEDAEKHRYAPVNVAICTSHTKDNWASHRGYVDNLDGTVSCRFCPWGTRLPGWYRVLDEHIVDLRDLNRG